MPEIDDDLIDRLTHDAEFVDLIDETPPPANSGRWVFKAIAVVITLYALGALYIF